MHLPWKSHAASGSVVQLLSEPEVISWCLILSNWHINGEKKKIWRFWTNLNFSILNIQRQFHSLAVLEASYFFLSTFVFHFLLDSCVHCPLCLALEKIVMTFHISVICLLSCSLLNYSYICEQVHAFGNACRSSECLYYSNIMLQVILEYGNKKKKKHFRA